MQKKRPNLLYILNDHQAYYGHTQAYRPVFERFASQGIHFENAYSVCPLCGPARRSMLTGLYPHNHGEKHNDDDHPFDQPLYLDILAEGGYRQYYYGKWHAGGETALQHGCEGFNYPSYNNPYTKPEYKAYLRENNLPEPEIFIEYDFIEGSDRQGRMIKQNEAWCNEHCAGVMTTPKETHEAFFLAHQAKDKLRQLAESAKDKPFSMRVDFWGPHPPYFPTQEFADLYSPCDIRLPLSLRENVYTNNKPTIYAAEHNRGLNRDGKIIYPSPLDEDDWRHILARCYAQTTLVDAAAGVILDALCEFGLEEDTLVIMTTDHGDAVACHGGHFDKVSYMPEEMVRIPMAMRWPGTVPAGWRSKAFVSNLDVGPTLLDAAGLGYPKAVDGAPLLDIVRQGEAAWRDCTVCETHGHFGDHIGRALITKAYKYIYNENDLDELYDLEKDPWELDNLTVKEAWGGVLQTMRQKLWAWAQQTADKAVLESKELREYFAR